MRNIITYLVLFACLPMFSQKQVSDSLDAALKKADHDTLKCHLINQIIEVISDEDVLPYAELLKKISLEHLATDANTGYLFRYYTANLATAYNSIGQSFNRTGENKKALEQYEKAMSLYASINELKGVAGVHTNMGYIYRHQGDINKGLDHYQKALVINEKLKNKEEIATNLLSIGYLYFDQGDTIKGKEFCEKGLALNEQIGNISGIATGLNNLGMMKYSMGDVEGAIRNFEKSSELFNKIGERSNYAAGLNNIGFILQKKGDLKRSMEYYTKVLGIVSEVKDKNGMSVAHGNIGWVLAMQKKFKEAEAHFLTEMTLAKELGFPDNIGNAAYHLWGIYNALHDGKKALEYAEIRMLMNDSINNESNRKATIRSQLKYEYDTRAAADSVSHSKETLLKMALLEKQKAELDKRKKTQYILITGFLIVIVLSGVAFKRYKQIQLQKEIIENQKAQVELQKSIAEEKQKEILDSINYARRIQLAQIPSEKRVGLYLQRLKNQNT